MTAAEVINDARTVLQDLDGNYWTDKELLSYFDDGQLEFCRKTRMLRAQATILSRENEATYNFPSDLLSVIRFERDDGIELEPTSSGAIQGRRSGAWRDSTGTPTHFYQDLDGEGQFRLFPQPTTDFHVSGVAFTKGEMDMAPLRFAVGSIKSVATMSGRIFLVDEDNFYELNEDFGLSRQVAHGLTITESVFIRPVPMDAKPSSLPAPYVAATVGDVWIWHDTSVRIIDRDGTVTNWTDSLSSKVTGVAAFLPASAWMVGWSSEDNNLYNSPVGALSETSVSGPGAIYYSEPGTDKVHALFLSSPPVTQYSLNFITFAWASDASVTVTDPRLAIRDSFTNLNDVVDEEPAFYSLYCVDQYTAKHLGGVLLVSEQGRLWYGRKNQQEYGILVNIDDIAAESEYGSVEDIDNDSEAVYFEGDAGVVSSIVDADKHPSVFYSRAPRKGVFELADIDANAIRDYILSEAWAKDGEAQQMAKSHMRMKLFEAGCARASKRSNLNFNKKPRRVRGRHF